MQNDELPVALFIAVWTPLIQAGVSEPHVPVEPEFITGIGGTSLRCGIDRHSDERSYSEIGDPKREDHKNRREDGGFDRGSGIRTS